MQEEFIDADEVYSKEKESFNFEQLLMEQFRRVDEAGSHEMRGAYVSEKVGRDGMPIKVTVEDTRDKYIECVKTLYDILYPYLNSSTNEALNSLFSAIKNEKKYLLDLQEKWVEGLPPNKRAILISQFGNNVFNIVFIKADLWYEKFKEFEVDAYRSISRELRKICKEAGFGKNLELTDVTIARQ